MVPKGFFSFFSLSSLWRSPLSLPPLSFNKNPKVVEVAASYQVCSGGLETRRGFVRIDEDGFDIGDLTSSDSSSGN